MPNAYTQFYVHLVFSPKHRAALIRKWWKDSIEKYITGIIQNKGHKLLAIYAMPDHIHIFIGYNVNQKIPDLVNDIKRSSSTWINDNQFTRFHFHWQRGYGAFSHSRSAVDTVVKYVLNQEEHHAQKSFQEEYKEILKENDIEFKDEYLFDFFEDVHGWE